MHICNDLLLKSLQSTLPLHHHPDNTFSFFRVLFGCSNIAHFKYFTKCGCKYSLFILLHFGRQTALNHFGSFIGILSKLTLFSKQRLRHGTLLKRKREISLPPYHYTLSLSREYSSIASII